MSVTPAILNKADAARYIGMCPRSFDKLIETGEVQGYLARPTAKVMFKRVDLDKYIASLKPGRGTYRGS